MHDQATALRERLRPPKPVAEVWAVATLGGERGALQFSREILEALRPAPLSVRLWGGETDGASVVLLPAGEGRKNVRRPYMRGAHTWLLLCPATPVGYAECQALLGEMVDRSLRRVYLALSGVESVQAGEAEVERFSGMLGPGIPYQPQPFGFYGPNDQGALTLAPSALRRFFQPGR
jgi:hypothetical protein